MKDRWAHYQTLIQLVLGILAVFIIRTLLAAKFNPPRLNDLFTAVTIVGSLFVSIRWVRCLQKRDWVIAILAGCVVCAGMFFARLYTPYPFFGVIRGNLGQGLVRGLGVTLALLGGLAIMRQNGPVPILAAFANWRKTAGSIVLGLVIGVPLAVLNVFALQISQGRPVQWQAPFASLLDALQPAVVEEVIYRFAMWGLIWLVLRKSLPGQAVWLSGLLALLIHNYGHFDDLFLQSPLTALGMGLVMGIFWGLPPAFLARRSSLEAAVSFHWIQDVARFFAGF